MCLQIIYVSIYICHQIVLLRECICMKQCVFRIYQELKVFHLCKCSNHIWKTSERNKFKIMILKCKSLFKWKFCKCFIIGFFSRQPLVGFMVLCLPTFPYLHKHVLLRVLEKKQIVHTDYWICISIHSTLLTFNCLLQWVKWNWNNQSNSHSSCVKGQYPNPLSTKGPFHHRWSTSCRV